MWAWAWFLSVLLFQLWFLYPLCWMQKICSVITTGFPFKKPFCLMKVYCGKLHANLFAGLHLGHPSSVSLSYCVLGRKKLALVQKIADLNIKSSPMEKEKHWWENNQNDSSFPLHATCRQGISPPTASMEQAFAKSSFQLYHPLEWLCTGKTWTWKTKMVGKMKYLHQIRNLRIRF